MSDLDLSRRLVTRAERMRQDDPGRALDLAVAARTLASGVDRRRVARSVWRVLQIEAWTSLSSAQRALGHDEYAEASLGVALAFLDTKVAADAPNLPPRLAQRAAYLRAGQERFEESLALIDEAVEAFDRLGQTRRLATALVDRAVIFADSGRKQLAVHALCHALAHHADAMSHRTFLAAVHNTAVFAHETAQTTTERREALSWLRLAVHCHARMPANAERLKLRALLGLSAIGLGLTEEGLTELWTAHAAFKRLGFARQQALTLLDLARAALLTERPDELRRVAGEMFAVLHAFRRDRQCRTALLHFCRALQGGGLTLSLVTRTANTMRTAE